MHPRLPRFPSSMPKVASVRPSCSKIAIKKSLSFPPTLSVSYYSKSTICDPREPPQGQKSTWNAPKITIFSLVHAQSGQCEAIKVVKLHLKRLWHFHLPSLYPDTQSQPSVTLGAPLRAQKQPQMHPRSQHFPLSMLKVASVRPSHSKIASKTSLSFPPTQSVSWHPKSTICDLRGTSQVPKAFKIAPKIATFSFVRAKSC